MMQQKGWLSTTVRYAAAMILTTQAGWYKHYHSTIFIIWIQWITQSCIYSNSTSTMTSAVLRHKEFRLGKTISDELTDSFCVTSSSLTLSSCLRLRASRSWASSEPTAIFYFTSYWNTGKSGCWWDQGVVLPQYWHRQQQHDVVWFQYRVCVFVFFSRARTTRTWQKPQDRKSWTVEEVSWEVTGHFFPRFSLSSHFIEGEVIYFSVLQKFWLGADLPHREKSLPSFLTNFSARSVALLEMSNSHERGQHQTASLSE